MYSSRKAYSTRDNKVSVQILKFFHIRTLKMHDLNNCESYGHTYVPLSLYYNFCVRLMTVVIHVKIIEPVQTICFSLDNFSIHALMEI